MIRHTNPMATWGENEDKIFVQNPRSSYSPSIKKLGMYAIQKITPAPTDAVFAVRKESKNIATILCAYIPLAMF